MFEFIKRSVSSALDSAGIRETTEKKSEEIEENVDVEAETSEFCDNISDISIFSDSILNIPTIMDNINVVFNRVDREKNYEQIKKSEKYKNVFNSISLDLLKEIGETVSLSQLKCLDNNDYFNMINELTHGERLDNSLSDYKVKVGDKEVKIMFDNNIVSSGWAKEHGIPKNGSVLTEDIKESISDTLNQLNESGQTLPEKIYFTDLFKYDERINSVAAGEFCIANPNAIFINSKN